MLRLALLIVCLAGPAFGQSRADPEAASGRAAKPLATAERHMIVAAHPAASDIGLSILRAGGSA
ncbi:MAG: gamma-glutamyltransferase, partial [Pseudomonadota bacterium]